VELRFYVVCSFDELQGCNGFAYGKHLMLVSWVQGGVGLKSE
jgi:hypothetical protein